MADPVPTSEVEQSAAETRAALAEIAEHHSAAEAAAERGDFATAEAENGLANALAEDLQDKIGPNHTVNTDGTISYNQSAGGGFDIAQAQATDRLADGSDLTAEDVILAGPDASAGALEVVEVNEAEQVEQDQQEYLDQLLIESGIDPATATEDDLRHVVTKEELDQAGILAEIEASGEDPDALSPEELDQAAAEVVAAREAELLEDAGGGPTGIDENLDRGTGDAPDSATNGDPRQGEAAPPEPDENVGGLLDGDRPSTDQPAGDGAGGGSGDGGGSSGGGTAPRDGAGLEPDGSPVGGERPDSPDPTLGPDEPADDPGGAAPGDDGAGVRMVTVTYPIGDTNGDGISELGAETVPVQYDAAGNPFVVTADGKKHDVILNDPNESQPVEEGVPVENLHADDPVVAQMIQQGHDAKRGGDIDYGDGEPALVDGSTPVLPDQIDYGQGHVEPDVDPDEVDLGDPDAGVIDPNPLGDVEVETGGRSDGSPIDDLQRSQNESNASSDVDFGAGDDGVDDGATGDGEADPEPSPGAAETPGPDPHSDGSTSDDPIRSELPSGDDQTMPVTDDLDQTAIDTTDDDDGFAVLES